MIVSTERLHARSRSLPASVLFDLFRRTAGWADASGDVVNIVYTAGSEESEKNSRLIMPSVTYKRGSAYVYTNVLIGS